MIVELFSVPPVVLSEAIWDFYFNADSLGGCALAESKLFFDFRPKGDTSSRCVDVAEPQGLSLRIKP